MAVLGKCLVRSVRTLRHARLHAEDRRRWGAVWAELAGGQEHMRIPLRMLQAAINYLEDGRETALLALPSEERNLLDALLVQ